MMDMLEKLDEESVRLISSDECRISPLFVVAVGEDNAVVAVDLDLKRPGDLVKLMGDEGVLSPWTDCCLFLSNTRSQSCLISSVSACSTNEACCLVDCTTWKQNRLSASAEACT